MKKIRTVAACVTLALVAAACGTTITENVYVEPEESRNAAFASDDGLPRTGLNCCVKDIAKDSSGNIWAVGSFSVRGFGTGGAAQLTPSLATLPRVTGTVNKVLSDGSGGYYLAGPITAIGKTPTGPLVHITSSATLDRAFAPVLAANVTVRDLALGTDSANRPVLYVGLDGEVVKMDPVTGASRGRIDLTYRGAPTVVDRPKLVATSRGLVVAGDFLVEGGYFITGAIFIAKSGSAIAALELYDADAQGQFVDWGYLYAAETYKTSTGVDVIHLGGLFDSLRVWTPTAVEAVRQVKNAVRLTWDNAGVKSGPGPTFDGAVRTIAVGMTGINTVVHFGGDFANAQGGNELFAPFVVTYTENSLTGVRQMSALASPNGRVSHIGTATVDGYDMVVISGAFSIVDEKMRRGMVVLAKRQGQESGWFQTGSLKFATHDGQIKSLALGGAGIVVGGSFSVVGWPVGNIVKMDPDGRFVPGVDAVTVLPNGAVNAIEIRDGKVYVGGWFNSVGGNPVSGLARYREDGTFDNTMGIRMARADWGSVGVNDIALDGETLYIGGQFDGYSDVNRPGPVRNMANFVALNASDLSPSNRLPMPTNGTVSSISVSPDGTSVAVGGDFKTIGGVIVDGSAILVGGDGRLGDFRSGARAGSRVESVAFAPDGQSIFVGYLTNEAALVRYSLRGDVLRRFIDFGARVSKVAAGGDRVYVGLQDRPMKALDAATNDEIAQFPGFPFGTTALLADANGVWMGGIGATVADKPVYGPVRVSPTGEVLLNPSSAANAGALTPEANGGTGSATPSPSEPGSDALSGPPVGPTELPVDRVVHQGVSTGAGRVADGAGSEFGYRIAGDGTIELDPADVDRSPSRTFMVTKLKPGNRAVTVTFVTPVGIRDVKVKAHPSGRTLVCSPGKKKSCTIKGLDPTKSYRFSVQGKLGKKSTTSPRSFATKPVVSMRRGATATLNSLVGSMKGKVVYTADGGCRIVSKKTKVSTPKSKTHCVVTAAATTKSGLRVRSVVVKVG